MMRMLEQLRIVAYRSLRNLHVDRFGQMSLFVGGNNAGKTSVLEAIGLVARPMDPGQWVQTATNRDSSGPLIDGLWSLFQGNRALNLETDSQSSTGIDIRAVLDGNDRHLQARALASLEEWADVERGDAQTDALLRINVQVMAADGKPQVHQMEFSSTQRRMAVGYGVPLVRVFVVTPMTHRSTHQLVSHLSHVIDAGVKAKSIELLRMFDPDVTDVEISRPFGRAAIRVVHEKNGVVDLATFGDGMRRAFAMSVVLARARGGILLIDEIESTIHARLLDSVLPWLMRAAGEADVQMIATTHSLETIDALLAVDTDVDPEQVVTYHLRRAEGGHVCHRYDLAGLRALREEGLDIR